MQSAYKNSKALNTLRYALIQGDYWMSYCVIFSFASIYLLAQGFTSTQIGIVVAIASSIAALLQPVVGEMVDRYKQITLQKVTVFFSVIILFIGIALYCFQMRPLVIMILYGFMIGILQVQVPLINALGMYYMNRKVTMNFGVARGAGSICYAVISMIVGNLIARYDETLIPIFIIFTIVIFIIVVFTFRFKQADKMDEIKQTQVGSDESLSFHKQYPKFILLIVALVFIFISHNMLANFLFQIVQYYDGDSNAMGIAGSVAAASELPTMCLFSYYIKKLSSDQLIKISGIFFVLKALGTYLATGLAMMYAAQAFQMFGFALFAVASVYYVNERIQEKDRVKGQAYVTMTMSLGTVIGSLIGGILIDKVSIHGMLLAATILGMIGAVGMFLFAENTSTKNIGTENVHKEDKTVFE